jgi:hypothetical protein
MRKLSCVNFMYLRVTYKLVLTFAPNKAIDTVYSNLPGFIKEIDNYNSFKKELKQIVPLHTFH